MRIIVSRLKKMLDTEKIVKSHMPPAFSLKLPQLINELLGMVYIFPKMEAYNLKAV